MYKANRYTKPYVLDSAQRIYVKTWLTKYSDVNDEKITNLDWKGCHGIPWQISIT